MAAVMILRREQFEEPDMNDKPKRRWYQFSLRTLLVGMTVLCLGPGGYVAYQQNKAKRQRGATEALEKLGVIVQSNRMAPTRMSEKPSLFTSPAVPTDQPKSEEAWSLSPVHTGMRERPVLDPWKT